MEKKELPKCIICKYPLDISAPYFGYHINKKGEIEKCKFKMRLITKGWKRYKAYAESYTRNNVKSK